VDTIVRQLPRRIRMNPRLFDVLPPWRGFNTELGPQSREATTTAATPNQTASQKPSEPSDCAAETRTMTPGRWAVGGRKRLPYGASYIPVSGCICTRS
jgi:hypothetical protein